MRSALSGTRDAPLRTMQLATARACFEALAARGEEPGLEGVTGVWEFDIDDAPEAERAWFVRVEDGRLAVNDPASRAARADVRIHMHEADFVRLVCGTERENIVTALLRGALTVEGDLRFAHQLQRVLPIPDGREQERKAP